MEAKTHWVFDQFYPKADALRQAIDDHFNEGIAKQKPFAKRTVWNYWFIDKLYTYLRTLPVHIFPGYMPNFMLHLQHFAAVNFGLQCTAEPFLSMYVSGCGQAIHNDAENGRLAYVFSLTHWEKRRFDGGETAIYRFPDTGRSFRAAAADQFYELVAPEFNRMVLFDDRIPHAVRPIQGTMNPADARFVLHGHMIEPRGMAYKEGGLLDVTLLPWWEEVRERVADIIISYGYHGFVTADMAVAPSGRTEAVTLKHTQLLPHAAKTKKLSLCIADIQETITRQSWPESDRPSKLITAFSSAPLKK